MPKTKTNSSAKKRFRITATGKIRFKHAFKNHILTKKEKKSKRAMGNAAFVHPTNMDNVKFMLKIG